VREQPTPHFVSFILVTRFSSERWGGKHPHRRRVVHFFPAPRFPFPSSCVFLLRLMYYLYFLNFFYVGWFPIPSRCAPAEKYILFFLNGVLP